MFELYMFVFSSLLHTNAYFYCVGSWNRLTAIRSMFSMSKDTDTEGYESLKEEQNPDLSRVYI